MFTLGLYDEEEEAKEEEEEGVPVLDIEEKESPLLKGFFVAAEGKARLGATLTGEKEEEEEGREEEPPPPGNTSPLDSLKKFWFLFGSE